MHYTKYKDSGMCQVSVFLNMESLNTWKISSMNNFKNWGSELYNKVFLAYGT